MINSMITIGGHLTDRVMCNEKGAPMDLATLYPSQYQFRLKLIDRDPTGKSVVVYPHLTSLSASIGLIYAEPRAGTFKLRYGEGVGAGTPTAEIDFKENPEDFRTKLAALTESTTFDLQEIYQPTPSTWMIHFGNPGELVIPLNGIENELEPETFIRVRQFIQNAETWLEVRLIQGPIASTSAYDTVLSSIPSVREIRRGFTEGDALSLSIIMVNEIQAITVPTDFTGTYIVKYQGRQSTPLSVTDGPQNVQDALNRMYSDGATVTRFIVTNPETNNAYIEFVGPFSGMPMPLLEIIVSSVGQADFIFNLDLNTTEVAEALQRNRSVPATFEVIIRITDPAIPEDTGQELVLFQQEVTINRPLHWEGLEEAAPIDWLLPPNPKDYVPFDRTQVIVGDLTYSTAFGDGVATSYVISHHLNSAALSVEVRENTSGGRKLKDEEYSIIFNDLNALTISMTAGAADDNGFLISIFASGPISAFINHTHTIGQVQGLQEALDGIIARLAALEAVLPSVIGLIPGSDSPFGTDPSQANIVAFTINPKSNVVPTTRKAKDDKIDPKSAVMPPAGLLLPAIHDVIGLGSFIVNPGTDLITLGGAASPVPVAGQRARIDTPLFAVVGFCSFDSTTDVITCPTHGLANGRRVKFTGSGLPEGLSQFVTYYVINSTIGTFQVSQVLGGTVNPLLTDGDAGAHSVYTISDLPSGLSDAVDYFMVAPTATTFKLSETIGGPVIDITSVGVGTLTISTIDEAPEIPTNGTATLPAPAAYKGNAYSVRHEIFISGNRGVPSETVVPGDIIASDGRIWYHVTRSASPGNNSFYPNTMEIELFRVALNDRMMTPGTVFTVTFDLMMQMFKHDTNVQYLLVMELAELPQTTTPSPTGPNLYEVDWKVKPALQQRIIVTDVLVKHTFGLQVLRSVQGILAANKKIYGVELAADLVPETPNFAVRARLVEFDTEENVDDAIGLVYYSFEAPLASVSNRMPTTPPAA